MPSFLPYLESLRFLMTFNEIVVSSLMEMCKRYKDEVLKQREVKLGFMSAFKSLKYNLFCPSGMK
jgi:hypothetical protein